MADSRQHTYMWLNSLKASCSPVIEIFTAVMFKSSRFEKILLSKPAFA